MDKTIFWLDILFDRLGDYLLEYNHTNDIKHLDFQELQDMLDYAEREYDGA